jgi:hypothetical protein
MNLFRGLTQFLRDYKLWWITPLAIMGALFVYLWLSSDGTGDSPFVYTLF